MNSGGTRRRAPGILCSGLAAENGPSCPRMSMALPRSVGPHALMSFLHPSWVSLHHIYNFPGIHGSSMLVGGNDGHAFRLSHFGSGFRAILPDRRGLPFGQEIAVDTLTLIIAAALFVYLLAALCKPEWFE